MRIMCHSYLMFFQAHTNFFWTSNTFYATSFAFYFISCLFFLYFSSSALAKWDFFPSWAMKAMKQEIFLVCCCVFLYSLFFHFNVVQTVFWVKLLLHTAVILLLLLHFASGRFESFFLFYFLFFIQSVSFLPRLGVFSNKSHYNDRALLNA